MYMNTPDIFFENRIKIHPDKKIWVNKRSIFIIILALFTLTTMAQNDGSVSLREKQKWAVDGLIALLAPAPATEYYNKNLECYSPVVPMIWFGTSWLNSSMTGDKQAQLPLRSGIFNKIDCGFTILQISRNLYRGIAGISAGLQFEGCFYKVLNDYCAEKDGYKVEFVPTDKEHKNNSLSFTALRIPLLIGAQTNNRLFSLQTGVGLNYTSRFGAQWLVTAGLGPFTINYSQNLTPLFKLNDGTKAYPSSLSIGVDIWYWICRFYKD